jgi:UDP-glucose 4-epimerase
LRPTNVIGPSLHNTMSSFLRLRTVPHLAGFDPMTQFIHADDLARAIVRAGVSVPDEAGVYNVAGNAEVPWRAALDLARAHSFPIPSSMASLYVRLFTRFPAYLVNFFKYPCVVTDRAFRQAFGWEPRLGIRETIWSTVEGARARQDAERAA